MPIPQLPEYIPDDDDPLTIDDSFARATKFRMERMNAHHYWMCVTKSSGEDIHIDVFLEDGTGRLKARVRQ